MFTPILITHKNTPELRNNVHATSKKLKFSRFFGLLCSDKKTLDKCETTTHHESVQCMREKSCPLGQNLTRDSASPCPWLKFRPLW